VAKREQALEELKKVQAAPEAQTEKSERRVRETDPEARGMKPSDGGHAPRHNVPISTDVAHAIIVGATVTQDGRDRGQREPALEEVQRQTGRRPGQMIVEAGYTPRENIRAADDRGVDLIGGTMQGDAEATARRLEKRGVAPAFYPQNFAYHPETHPYPCPEPKVLSYRTTQHDRGGVERQVYQARAADCRTGALRQACPPGKPGRRIVGTENVPTVAAYVAKMQTEAARAAYRGRAPGAEFSNAWRKAQLGLRQFCGRGLQKARGEVLWACRTYNMQPGFRLRWKVRGAAVPAGGTRRNAWPQGPSVRQKGLAQRLD
jgi:hypothetical protein